MKAIITFNNFVSDFVLTWWTPAFVAVFVAIVIYALRPSNSAAFDEAARMPLLED